ATKLEGELVVGLGVGVAGGLRVGRGVGRHHVPLAALLDALEDALSLQGLEEAREGRESVISLVEVGLLANDGLLDEGGIERAGRAREQAGDDLAGAVRHCARPPAPVARTGGAAPG